MFLSFIIVLLGNVSGECERIPLHKYSSPPPDTLCVDKYCCSRLTFWQLLLLDWKIERLRFSHLIFWMLIALCFTVFLQEFRRFYRKCAFHINYATYTNVATNTC